MQALVQTPLESNDGFRPGTGLNVNGGLRYREQAAVSPRVQMNLRSEGREGVNADVENSGGTLVYVSPA